MEQWHYFIVFAGGVAILFWAVQRLGEGVKPHLDGRSKNDPNWRVDDASPRGGDSDRTFS